MHEAGVGRLLVASLHQGIADLLPERLEFYESWLNPTGLRDGRIGLAPLNAVLSFLRLEGDPYRLVATRAGEYTAEWTAAELSSFHSSLLLRAPAAIRTRLVMRMARQMIRSTYSGSRVVVRWRKPHGEIDIRGSLFCSVREPVDEPLCVFYAAAIRKLMELFQLEVGVRNDRCRGAGGDECVMRLDVGPPAGAAP
jgi:predicted hydrocarbon binding protein